MIQYFAEEISLPSFNQQFITRWIKAVAQDYNKKTGDISYIFCNDQRILEINNKYLQHDYFTDIITFDYSEKSIISGDIFISVDTVNSNASELGISFEKELERILIHGILHLCGQDDYTPDLRKEMTHKENLALEKLK